MEISSESLELINADIEFDAITTDLSIGEDVEEVD